MAVTPRKKAQGRSRKGASPKPSQEEAKVTFINDVLSLEDDIRSFDYPEFDNSDREKIAFNNIAEAISTFRNARETNARLVRPAAVEA